MYILPGLFVQNAFLFIVLNSTTFHRQGSKQRVIKQNVKRDTFQIYVHSTVLCTFYDTEKFIDSSCSIFINY